MWDAYFYTSSMSPGVMGLVCMWRLSGQGRGHRSQKSRKFLFLQCKTLISNNSCSIKHRAVKSACSMGLHGANGVTAIFVTW